MDGLCLQETKNTDKVMMWCRASNTRRGEHLLPSLTFCPNPSTPLQACVYKGPPYGLLINTLVSALNSQIALRQRLYPNNVWWGIEYAVALTQFSNAWL